MPPTSKKASAADKAKDVSETEDPLQAVVLADSFETRFSPFTKDRPRCLLPLANIPLIEYTLEFLAASGVEEVFIYCGAHTEQVEQYFQDSKWTKSSSPFYLTTLRSPSRSIGDAMRDLDKRGILATDFLVVYGDVISNMSIEKALLEHRTRRAASKNAIMTMVLREGGRGSHNSSSTSPIFVTDPAQQRVLQYEQIRSAMEEGPHSLLIDPDVLLHSGATEIEVRHDLIDCGIDICTPDVLALWSDNFDYELPRRGFLHSVLKDYELNGKTIHTHIDSNGYANRARDLKSYDQISKDIMARRTWPISPDCSLGNSSGCEMYGGGFLKEEGTKVSKSARLSKKTLIGRGSKVGARTRINSSFIGRDCDIAEDCDISGSYIWDNVKIGRGTRISNAIVANNAVVDANCAVQPGTLISYNVHLKSNTTTEDRQRLVISNLRQDSTKLVKDFAQTNTDPIEYSPESSEDEDETSRLFASPRVRQRNDSISTISSSRSSSPDILPSHQRTPSISSNDAVTDFHTEATASILDSLIRSHDPSTIQLELQAQRMTANASEHAVRKAVAAAFITFILKKRSEPNGGGTTVKAILQKNGDLIKRVVFDYEGVVNSGESEGRKPDQVDLLMCMQRELAGEKDAAAVMLSVCNGLYESDLVEDEGLLAWWDDERGTATEDLKAVRSHPNMSRLIEIVGESEEEDDDESEDED